MCVAHIVAWRKCISFRTAIQTLGWRKCVSFQTVTHTEQTGMSRGDNAFHFILRHTKPRPLLLAKMHFISDRDTDRDPDGKKLPATWPPTFPSVTPSFYSC